MSVALAILAGGLIFEGLAWIDLIVPLRDKASVAPSTESRSTIPVEGKACRTSKVGQVLGTLHLPKRKELCPKSALHIKLGHLKVSQLLGLCAWLLHAAPMEAAESAHSRGVPQAMAKSFSASSRRKTASRAALDTPRTPASTGGSGEAGLCLATGLHHCPSESSEADSYVVCAPSRFRAACPIGIRVEL